MAVVVSVINLKGGVGKTTVTVGLAEFLAVNKRLKILVIDLDPQTNSSVALIGETEWEKRNLERQTLYQLFHDHLDDTSYFNLEKAIVRTSSKLNGGLENLHLLPSSLDLVRIQDKLGSIWQTAFIRPVDVLKQAIGNVVDQYDVVLIDCPPNLGLVTKNGLAISDGYLIPTIPDHLSTYGIPQIVQTVANLNQKFGTNVQPLGILFTMYRCQCCTA